MKICSTFPGIKHEFLSMPDGQPHIKVGEIIEPFRLDCRIASGNDILNLGLLLDVCCDRYKFRDIAVNLMYLTGGRMDRAISSREPYTLKVVASLLNSLPIARFNIFAPHSQASTDLLRNGTRMTYLESDFYYAATEWMKEKWQTDEISFVLPDLGAGKRLEGLTYFDEFHDFVTCHKKRDLDTGRIKEFKIVDGEPKKHCIIIDDLCDGGATFIKVSEALRANGAEKVGLAVCHGIFSRGPQVDGIDLIATTDSFCDWSAVASEKFFVYSVFPH